MTKKLPSKELSWEEAVAKYLEDNPNYFESHPDILTAMTIPHRDNGSAISLIERQVQVLREKNLSLQQQLRELVTIARENDVLGERLHHFAVAMADAASLEDVLGTARDILRQEFKLDSVAMFLQTENEALLGRPEFMAMDDKQFHTFLKQYASKKPLCGGKYDSSIMTYLFGEGAAHIKSTALIMMRDARREGVLCLGSRDPHRFHAQMGTIYLSRLGELLISAVGRYLNAM